MSPSQTYTRAQAPAFTLLELLVAIVVLGILLTLIGQLTNNIALSTAATHHRAAANRQARLLFDRMAMDFEGMPLRSDVDYLFPKQTGNDSMFFYSEAPAYFARDPSPSDRSLLGLIGYRIAPDSGLERLGKGLGWDGSPSGEAGGAIIFLTYPNRKAPSPTNLPIPESTLAGRWRRTIGTPPHYRGVDDDYHLISPHIYRIEVCFQLGADPATGEDATFSNNPFTPLHRDYCGLKDVRSIIVAIALMDESSAQLLGDSNKIEQSLPDPTDSDLNANPPKLMATIWREKLSTTGFAAEANIPAAAVGQIRIYQRSFRLKQP